MPDDSPVDFTQTVVGLATPLTSRGSTQSSHPSQNESLEGRFPPGTLLNGRYRVIALLGRGGMGEVYRATDLTLGQSVALKFLTLATGNDPRWLERFHGEVRIARQVSHPNVCRVYDIGETDGLPFISMEYVDGEDLSSLLRRIGRLPSDKAIEISRKVCAGLAAAHARGVIHRDLKPQNIMLDRRGEVLICDFGLAAVASELSAADARQGTPAYMAPEQLKGAEVTQQSDIYSLGLVLYELFTGRKAYSGANVNDLLNQQEAMSLTSMNSIATDIDPSVEKIIRRCLDPIPAQRPASALTVSGALPGGDPLAAALAAGQTPSPEMVAAAKSAGLPLRYSAPLLAAVLCFLIALPFLRAAVQGVNYAPIEFSTEVMFAKAHEAAIAMGYPDRPADYFGGYDGRSRLTDWLATQPPAGAKNWPQLFQFESPTIFSYRQSPEFLPVYPDGHVTMASPGLESPGSVRLSLDSRGALRSFEAIPPRTGDAAPPFDRAKLFQWMRHDQSAFQEVAPFRAPLTPFDERHAFAGPHDGFLNARVSFQYATWKGRLTSLYFQFPWSGPISPVVPKPSVVLVALDYFKVLGITAFFFYSIVIGRKNWLAGRADRKGAFRLGMLRFCLLAGYWFFTAHFIPDTKMVDFFGYGLAEWMLSGVILWNLYLALEPALRSRWPKAIVTWNRALSGNLLDAQVGSHVLMGVAMGLVIVATFHLRDYLALTREGQLQMQHAGLFSTRGWIAAILATADSAILSGLIIFFTLFGLRVLFRRELPAMLGASLLLTLSNGSLFTSKNLLADASVYYLISLAIIAGLVRFGTLTTVVAVFVTNLALRLCFSYDPSLWFMTYSIATLLLIGALAVFGFWRSLGDQPLVANDPR